jgi:hypothetical protein
MFWPGPIWRWVMVPAIGARQYPGDPAGKGREDRGAQIVIQRDPALGLHGGGEIAPVDAQHFQPGPLLVGGFEGRVLGRGRGRRGRRGQTDNGGQHEQDRHETAAENSQQQALNRHGHAFAGNRGLGRLMPARLRQLGIVSHGPSSSVVRHAPHSSMGVVVKTACQCSNIW